MKANISRLALMTLVASAGWLGVGSNGDVVATAQAIIGRPATPVSYAGVARRSTVVYPAAAVAVATPGLGAPGVGVMPGPGVAPVNLGGPFNRVGVR